MMEYLKGFGLGALILAPFFYFLIIPLYKEVNAGIKLEESWREDCNKQDGLVIIVLNSHTDKKLFCITKEFHIIPNGFNGLDAK